MGYFLINIRRYLDKDIFDLIAFEETAAAMGRARMAGNGNKEKLISC